MIPLVSHIVSSRCCSAAFLFSQLLQDQLIFWSFWSVLKSSLQQVSTVSKPKRSPLTGLKWLKSGNTKRSGVTWIVSMSSLWLLLFIWNCMYWYLLFSPVLLSCIFGLISAVWSHSPPWRASHFGFCTNTRCSCILCSASLAAVPSRFSLRRWVRNAHTSSSPVVSYWVLHSSRLGSMRRHLLSSPVRIGIFIFLLKKQNQKPEKSYLNPWKVQGGQRRIYTCHFNGKTELLIDGAKMMKS